MSPLFGGKNFGDKKKEEVPPIPKGEIWALRAIQVIQNPNVEIQGNFVMLVDNSTIQIPMFDTMTKAIDILSKKGWKVVSMTTYHDPASSILAPNGVSYCHVLMQRII
jgi:hypothetical protein